MAKKRKSKAPKRSKARPKASKKSSTRRKKPARAAKRSKKRRSKPASTRRAPAAPAPVAEPLLQEMFELPEEMPS